MTWEEAVQELRSNPEKKQVIIDNYFDEDVEAANERFSQSEEFSEVLKYLPKDAKTILDIGAGRGMATYGFAKRGFQVTALEPDQSNDVGTGAIKQLAAKHYLPISIVENFAEELPFETNSFDVVYERQVLHHAKDLKKFCNEVHRVLKPKGIFIATREHVLNKQSDLSQFLQSHPLHHLYGGENAFTLAYYLDCIKNSGLSISTIIHPYASVINFAPTSKMQMQQNFINSLSKIMGNTVASLLVKNDFFYNKITDLKANFDNTPGRIYSFIATKQK